MTVIVKAWKMAQIKVDNRNVTIFKNEGLVERETEKAYLLSFEAFTMDGEEDVTVTAWCPKSATMSPEEADAAADAHLSRYEALVKFAKENGIKGARKGMKAATLLTKIRQAGLVYQY